MPDPAPPSERRRAAREDSCFPAYVERGGLPKEPVLIADVSSNGALLLVRGGSYAHGDALRLELLIDVGAGKARNVSGKVLRIDDLPPHRVSVWTHQVAVGFDEEVLLEPDEERIIRAQCEALGLHRQP